MKPGDVARYLGNGTFGPYFNNLIEGDMVVVTDIFTHHTGKTLFVACDSKMRRGIVTTESLSPTLVKRESLSWAPKFVVGEYVYVKPHKNVDDISTIYGKPCKIIDLYVYDDEKVFVYEIDENEQIPVREKYLIREDDFDPEITPEDLKVIF